MDIALYAQSISVLQMWSYHVTPRICCWHFMHSYIQQTGHIHACIVHRISHTMAATRQVHSMSLHARAIRSMPTLKFTLLLCLSTDSYKKY